MPFIRIFHHNSTHSWPNQKQAIANAVYEALRETIQIPEGDRFIVFSEHADSQLYIDPHFPDMQRSDLFVLIHITLSKGRTVEQKQALYARIAERLQATANIPSDDIMIILNENNLEDWSFGKGQAQYVLNPPAWAQKS
jgi:phenylpyruvate tautomerase PptA (4-oxalocrotonate tautomerase family)